MPYPQKYVYLTHLYSANTHNLEYLILTTISMDKMEFLPSELRLRILAYGGDHPIGLRKSDLIDDIKSYDPSFSYPVWREDLMGRKSVEDEILTPGLINLYNYIKANNIVIYFSNIERREITLTSQYSQSTISITVLFKNAGYPVIGTKLSEQSTKVHITIDDPIDLQSKLALLWYTFEPPMVEPLYIHPRYLSYNKFKDDLRASKLHRLIPMIDVLEVPSTLPNYLRYTMSKHRIEQHDLYPLYTILNQWAWDIFRVDTSYTIHVSDITREESLANKETLLSMIPWTKYKRTSLTEILTLSTNQDISALMGIDLFFHPIRPITNFFE